MDCPPLPLSQHVAPQQTTGEAELMRQLSRARPPRPYIQSAPYRLQHKKKRRSNAAFFVDTGQLSLRQPAA